MIEGLKRSEVSKQFLSRGADRIRSAISGFGVREDVEPVGTKEYERERVAAVARAIQPLAKSL